MQVFSIRIDDLTALFELSLPLLLPLYIICTNIYYDLLSFIIINCDNAHLSDIFFSVCLPSVVGACCLTYSLLQHVDLSPEERKEFYVHLSKYTNLVEVMEAENRLIACGSSKLTNQGYEC